MGIFIVQYLLSNICIQNRFVSQKNYVFFFFTSDLNSIAMDTNTRARIIPLSIFFLLLFSSAIFCSFSFFTGAQFFSFLPIILRFFDFETDIEWESSSDFGSIKFFHLKSIEKLHTRIIF